MAHDMGSGGTSINYPSHVWPHVSYPRCEAAMSRCDHTCHRPEVEFEIVRIQDNLERIDSVYPVIRNKAVLDTLDEAKGTVQSIFPLFDKGIALLEKNP